MRLKFTQRSKVPTMPVRRRRRAAVIATAGSWLALAAADIAADLGRLPAIPTRLHTLAVGGCIAATIVVAWSRHQAPVRAAFLDGMLYERQSAATVVLPVLPRAAGDGGAVLSFSQPPRHRRPPSPWLRPR